MGYGRTFFIIGGIDCSFLRLREVLLWSIVGFALTAIGSFVFADNGTEYLYRQRFRLYGIPVFLQFQPHERRFTIFLHPAQLVKWACIQRNWYNGAVSGNQKTKLQSYPNSVFFPSNNEKRKTYAQQNFLKRKRPQPEHQATKRYVEVGMNSLHRTPESYIAPSPRQQICPAAADNPRVDEVESSEPRKRGSMEERGSAESFSFVLWCAARQQ